jgi:hypothetical protein
LEQFEKNASIGWKNTTRKMIGVNSLRQTPWLAGKILQARWLVWTVWNKRFHWPEKYYKRDDWCEQFETKAIIGWLMLLRFHHVIRIWLQTFFFWNEGYAIIQWEHIVSSLYIIVIDWRASMGI